jgi:hypothetical protein
LGVSVTTGGAAAARQPSWEPLITDRLLPEHVDALLRQEIAYVLIPGLLAPDWCAEITRRFVAFAEAHPNYRITMRTSTIDMVNRPMNVFMRPDDSDGQSYLDAYFDAVAQDRPRLREMFAGGADPYELVSGLWSRIGWKECPAVEGTRPYHTDVLWGLVPPSIATPHIDTYHRDTPCALSRFPYRFSCNTFIQPADSGGDFRVYRFRRQDGHFNEHNRPVSTAYQVRAGDLLIFDSGNFHEVEAIAGQRHRLFSHVVSVLDPATREYAIFA